MSTSALGMVREFSINVPNCFFDPQSKPRTCLPLKSPSACTLSCFQGCQIKSTLQLLKSSGYMLDIVILTDTDPPEVLSCPGPQSNIIKADSDTKSAVVSWSEPQFSDNSRIVSWSSGLIPGRYHEGSYQVNTIARDLYNNQAKCSFSFQVEA